MIELPITNNMRNTAHEMSEEMGILNRSITRGQGNVYGFLGELIALEVLGGNHCNTMDYDIIIDGKHIDVKTKKTTVKPLASYDCSIANLTRKQDCDYYAFVRVLSDQSKGWFLGMKERDAYFKEAIFLKKGEHDPSNNYTVRADCFNMKISSLDPVEWFKKERATQAAA